MTDFECKYKPANKDHKKRRAKRRMMLAIKEKGRIRDMKQEESNGEVIGVKFEKMGRKLWSQQCI